MDSDHLSFQFKQQAFDVLLKTGTQFYKGSIDNKENGEENVSFILVC